MRKGGVWGAHNNKYGETFSPINIKGTRQEKSNPLLPVFVAVIGSLVPFFSKCEQTHTTKQSRYLLRCLQAILLCATFVKAQTNVFNLQELD